MLTLVVTIAALYSLYHWWNRDHINLSIFFSCRDIHDAPDSSPCVYFRPTRYFFDAQQPGYAFKHIVEASDIRWTMWGKQVSTYHTPREGASPPSKFIQQHGISSVSAIMMPKVASRSIEALFQERLSVSVVDRMQMKIKGPRLGIATPSFWNKLAERQQSITHEHTTDIVFSLLRDPVSRFLSSLAQTLSMPMQRKYKACADLWKPCLESSKSYKDLVQCAISSMKQRPQSPYFDVHMAPQAVFLAGALDGKHDVEVAVFDIHSLEPILQAFGMSKQERMNTREEKEFSPNVMNQYGEELLNPRKARKVLDDEMIRDICTLYAMDVTLLHHLGFSAGDCD